MTEIEEKKEYLNEYRKLCKKVNSLEEQIKSLAELEQSAKAQTISDMPRGSRKTDMSDYIVRLERLREDIYIKKLDKNRKKLDIEASVSGLEDGTESAVIRKRYIEFKPWEQICMEIGYAWRQTHRIHSDALKHIQMV